MILLAVASIITVAFVVIEIQDARQIGVWAQVTGKRCHEASDGGGGASARPHRSMNCDVDLRYTTPGGTRGSVEFSGVNAFRLHRDATGHERLKIYFAPGSDTAVNPQDRPPVWAASLIIAIAWLLAGGGAWYLLRRPAGTRATAG